MINSFNTAFFKKTYLEKWERLPTINGTSIRMFESILNNEPWKVQWIKRPIFYDGRKADLLIFKLLKTLIYPLVFIKYLDDKTLTLQTLTGFSKFQKYPM